MSHATSARQSRPPHRRYGGTPFEDGEIIHAKLLALDPDDHEDITCEVVRVIAQGTSASRGTQVGAIIVGDLHELLDY